MALKKGGLGRGLASILEDTAVNTETAGIRKVRIADIEPNADQPRKTFDPEELASLADSIAEYGVIQPITVRPVGDRYQIIAGERRWRAARMAGCTEVPIIVLDADDKKSAEIALVENIQRKNLSPLEEAEAYETLIEQYGLTQEEVGKRVGKSRTGVTNSIRLLDLSDQAKILVDNGQITEGHAKVLLGIKDPKEMDNAAAIVASKQLSVRETERLVKSVLTPKTEKESKAQDGLKYTKLLEKEVQKKLGRTVKITENGEKSSVTIGYTSNDDLEKLLKLLCGDDFVTKI